MINKIHFWQFPKKEIYILLDKKFRRLLINNSKTNTNSKNYYQLSLILNKKSQKYDIQTKFNGGDIKRWIIGENKDFRTDKIHPKYIPLWCVIELSKIAKLELKRIEEHIIGYRSGTRGKIINNPKLPILVTPEFDSIIIHLFGDGYVNNKIMTPSYCQKNEEDRILFIKKLTNTFGSFEGNLQEGKVFRFPKAITRILSRYYNISSYMSKDAIIPFDILNKNKNHKLACILAFILDEGGIRDIISCFSINKNLLSQIRSLFQDCGYKCNIIRYYNGCYCFTMKNNSVNKLYKDINKLKTLYPTCNLGTKFVKLQNLYLKPRGTDR